MKMKTRLSICNTGCNMLKLFMAATAVTIVFFLMGFLGRIKGHGSLMEEPVFWGIAVLIAILILAIFFWNNNGLSYFSAAWNQIQGFRNNIWNDSNCKHNNALQDC